MKFRTTRKKILEQCPENYLRCAGYCDLQHLLNYHSPIAYTCGIYGWNFDVYDIDGFIICTGYRGMPGKRANNIDKYEKLAEKTLYDRSLSFEERKEKLDALLKEFLEQA